ncbi:MAG: hypothetical protein A3I01_15340 [Betaproteobacteria bacterium RIFCSPLOWO2_02_FULL_65_24]|nr:MAG: hypothetical protein A3I01_15340 [Betaproteobacteria bacterium RIFCSPLOWO2_02_FULL_65_24]
MKRATDFQTIRSEGGLLPPDLLRRVLDPAAKFEGTRPEDYGLPQGERLNEVITQSWNRLRKHWAEFQAATANLPEGEPATGLTNDKWSLPLLRELGFGLLPIVLATRGESFCDSTLPICRRSGVFRRAVNQSRSFCLRPPGKGAAVQRWSIWSGRPSCRRKSCWCNGLITRLSFQST